ncbi:MAG: transcriptional regulator [Flavobacteriaceae bacterium]|nr:MAG: transcriptional regulator [Flavobacteriaceae bacterium]
MKKISYGILIILFMGLLWYLFVKPSDYIIRFTAKTFPGDINQTLKLWNQNLSNSKEKLAGQTIEDNGDLLHLVQNIKFGDSVHTYYWDIKPLTDSTSKVIVGVTDKEHSILNRIKIPFSKTDFEKRSEKTVLDFMQNLREHTKNFKITIIGEAEIPSKYIAYIPIKGKQFEKADGMMRNFTFLTNELFINGAEFNGPPIIEVTYWDKKNDSIHFNFGQPIIRSENLPIGQEIKYKRIFKKKALKAEYNGNYITSDRAWYALLNYAKKNNIEVDATPFEVFHNNPNTGGDEINWKAEVYLPIK